MQGKRCYYYVITSRNAPALVCTLGEAYDLVLLLRLLLRLLLLGQSKITRSILRKTATTTSHRRRREKKQTIDD
jgi:PHD/YefM family antitoxin component YafN of YafNO toxin-antitoxin module